MEPQNTSSIPRINLKWLIIGFLIVVTIIITVALLLRASYSSYTVAETPLHIDRNFTQLKGSSLYAYNGLAFYKINLAQNNQVTTLNKGLKLPTPKTMYWADDKGALVTFDGSFLVTEVERALQSQGQIVDNTTSNYTWYIDFANSSVHLVSRFALLPNSVAFSSSEKGFYYIPDMEEVETDDFTASNTPLHFFNVETKSDEKVTNTLDVVDVSSIATCSDISMRVCLIARDKEDPSITKVIGVSRENKTSTLLDSYSRVLPTSSPALYITTIDDAKEKGADRALFSNNSPEEDTEYSPMKTKLHDLKNKTTTDLAFLVAGESVFAHFNSPKDYYAFTTDTTDPQKGTTFINSGQSALGTVSTEEQSLAFPDGRIYNGGVQDIAGYGDNKMALINTVGGAQLLFAPSSQQKTVKRIEKDKVQSLVDRCKPADSTVDYYEDVKQFRVIFTYNNSFSQSVASFANCIADTDKQALIGYNFRFGARANDRLVTD